MRHYALLMAAAVLAWTALPARAEAPNLGGKWKFNHAKSNLDNPPDDMRAVIRDEGGKIHMVQTETRDGQPRSMEFTFNKEGESVNAIGETTMKTTFKADGDRLLETTVFSGPDGEITRKSVITVAADRSTMTMEGVIATPGGETKFKLVMDKDE